MDLSWSISVPRISNIWHHCWLCLQLILQFAFYKSTLQLNMSPNAEYQRIHYWIDTHYLMLEYHWSHNNECLTTHCQGKQPFGHTSSITKWFDDSLLWNRLFHFICVFIMFSLLHHHHHNHTFLPTTNLSF